MEIKIKELFTKLQQTEAIEDVSLEYILNHLKLDNNSIEIIDNIAESMNIEIQNEIYCNDNHLERIVGKNTSRYIDLLAYCNICDKSFVIRDESIKRIYKL